jgi:hypothetical protein
MPRRRTRIAALENVVRSTVGAPRLLPATQYVYPEGIPSAEAFGTPTVVTRGIAEERDEALPLSFVKRGGASLNVGGGGGITRGIKIEGRRIRVRLTARRVVVVTTKTGPQMDDGAASSQDDAAMRCPDPSTASAAQ